MIAIFYQDESLNYFTQTSEINLLARFFDKSRNTFNTRFNSSFLGHATHQDLHIQFSDISNKLDSNTFFQISTDGPNVNLKFYVL